MQSGCQVTVKIVVFGAGPIGLVTSLSLCHLGHEVLCIDINSELIQKLSQGHCELYEKGLQQQLETSLKNKQIQFTTDLKIACEFSEIFFIAVGTPSQSNGSCDLSQIESSLKSIHSHSSESVKKIVIKSTVPPGTHQKFAEKYIDSIFISHPEFLREGSAFQDAIHPDRIVIGYTKGEAEQLIRQIYGQMIQKTKLIMTDPASAELAKYAANSFLAARISLMNEFSKLADHYNGDIRTISEIVGSDHRIGPHFLNVGIGYGGSCFPKDLQSLISIGEENQIHLPLIKAIETANNDQHKRFTELINKHCSEKKICLWGLTFKPETNDLRNASSIKIIQNLIQDGYTIHAHDPVKPDLFFKIFENDLKNKNILYFENHWDALNGCSGVALITEWSIYCNIDTNQLSRTLQGRPFFDGRLVYNSQQMKVAEINYFSLGQRK